ncbi:MAG: hypothetical protein ACRCZ2_05140, partial [Fusobacteriaceae bacterium]
FIFPPFIKRGMIIANVKSAQDLSSKRNLQQQLLDLEVANEAESEKRVKNYKNPNRPVPIAPEYKTNSELQKDKIAQERQAIKNMEELGFDYAKSAELVVWLSSSLINKLVEFNANFKGIKKELVETTNPKLINLEFVKSYLEKYFEDIDINFGRKFSKDAMSGQLAPATIEELDNLIPQPADLERLKLLLDGTATDMRNEIFEVFIARETDAENWIEDNFLSRDEEDALSERDKRNYRNTMKTYQKIVEDSRKSLSFIEELIPKIRYASTLVDLYSAIVPSNETFNLLKTGLTQKERGDVIRRYITILKSIQFLSKDGVEEITDEIGRLGGMRNIDLDALNIGVNKLTKSLSFLTKEKGADQITKLQRDIEVLMNQSGKLAELDKMKSINDVRERRVAEAEVAIKSAFDLDEITDYDKRMMTRGGPINLQQDERDQIARQQALERDRTMAIERKALQEQISRGIKDNIAVGMFFEEPQIERPLLRRSTQLAGQPDVQGVIDGILKLHNNFVDELTAMADQDVGIAVNTARNFLREYAGKTDHQLRKRQKEGKGDHFARLLDMIGDYAQEKERRIIQGAKDGQYDIVDYDYIANADRATLYDRKNNPTNIISTYGIGLQKSLKQHFKEDEAELKNMAKSLRKHKAMEKKIDKYAEDSSSSSDEDLPFEKGNKTGGSGGGTPPFKHKRVKVGRGIESDKARSVSRGSEVSQGISVKKQPAYKTFGKYVIHMGHLLDKNVANFKYPSLGSIPSIKPMTISEDYKEFLLDTLENGKPNERTLNKLDDEEQRHFERVVLGAGLIDAFKLKRNHTDRERKEAERFHLLRGEILAGNNAESVSKELRSLIVRFMNEGRIHQREGTTMLMELATL